MKLKWLSERTIALLFAANGGTMEENYREMEENFYISECEGILDFCQWIDKEVGGCSRYNIDMLFSAYKGNSYAMQKAKELKVKIDEIKKRSRR